MNHAPQVAVIGAGLSGLIAARTMQEHGLSVMVVDKGRRVGGRCSTQRTPQAVFDKGAQFFTARAPQVQQLVDRWCEAGVVAPWEARLVRFAHGVKEPAKAATRYVGVGGMRALPVHLAQGLEVENRVHIADVVRRDGGWGLIDDQGERLCEAETVLVTVPAPQAVALLAAVPDLQAAAREIDLLPSLCAMVSYPSRIDPGFDGAFFGDDETFSWVANNVSKPGHDAAPGDAWTLHSSASYAQKRLEDDPDEVAQDLAQVFAQRFLPGATPAQVEGFRWRYALAAGPVEGGCLFSPADRIGACGDWCHGGRVEGALLSGLTLAERVIESVSPRG